MPSGVMEDAKGGFGGMFFSNHPCHHVFVMFRIFEMILSKC